jgi:hypothetical protein
VIIMHMHINGLLTGGGGGSGGNGDGTGSADSIEFVLAQAPGAASTFTTSVAVLLLTIITLIYMFRQKDLSVFDYIVALIVGVALSTAEFIRYLANIIPGYFTEKSAENGMTGSGVYWFFVALVFAFSTWMFFRGLRKDKSSKGDKFWIGMVLLMAALLAGSAWGAAIIGFVNDFVSSAS